MPPDDGLQLVSGSQPVQEALFDRMAQNEIAVIAGAIYGGPEVVLRASALLAPDSFYLETHRLIFEAAVALVERGVRPDLVTITDELRVHGRLDVAGGIAGVDSVIHAFATAENVPVYCRLLRSSASRRRISYACDAASHGARNGTTTEEILRLLQHVQQEGEVLASDAVGAGVSYVDFSQELPAMDWIVTGWLVRQDVAIMAGEAGIGKSTTLAALALAIATGKTWCGVDVCSPLRVLYFDEEQSLPEVHRLFKRLGAPSENLRVAVGQGLNFSTPQGLQRLENEIRDFHPDVVFFDSLTHALLGIPENNANEVAKVYSESILRLRRDYDLAFVFSHHLSKPPGDSRAQMSDLQRVRGSTAHTAQCSTVWVATSSDGMLEVQQLKRRGAKNLGMRIKYESENEGTITLIGQPTIAEIIVAAKSKGEKTRQRILELVEGATEPITIAKLSELTGLGRRTIGDYLSHFVDSGKASRVRFGSTHAFTKAESGGMAETDNNFRQLALNGWESTDYQDDDA